PFALHLPHFADAASNAAGIGRYDMQLTPRLVKYYDRLLYYTLPFPALPGVMYVRHMYEYLRRRQRWSLLSDLVVAQIVAALLGTASFSCVALRLGLHHLAPACRDLVPLSLEVNGHP
ncbi:hypothetical protein CI102_6543, partial [Trichoderma harzianum]